MRNFVIGLLGFIGYAGGSCGVALLMRWLMGDGAGLIAAVAYAVLFLVAAYRLKWINDDEPTSRWYDDIHVMD